MGVGSGVGKAVAAGAGVVVGIWVDVWAGVAATVATGVAVAVGSGLGVWAGAAVLVGSVTFVGVCVGCGVAAFGCGVAVGATTAVGAGSEHAAKASRAKIAADSSAFAMSWLPSFCRCPARHFTAWLRGFLHGARPRRGEVPNEFSLRIRGLPFVFVPLCPNPVG